MYARRKYAILALAPVSVGFWLPAANAQKLYWTDVWNRTIQRANLDGSAVETLLAGGAGFTQDLALDLVAGKMYWTECPDWFGEYGLRRIRRANLDGTNIENLITGDSDLDCPTGIALDPRAGKMYWGDGRSIRRADLDGSDMEVLIAWTGSGWAYGLALDISAGKMYWAVAWGCEIRRANLDGSDVEVLVSCSLPVGGIALDPGAGKMYWGEGMWMAPFWLKRANLDGSGAETLYEGGCGDSHFMALDVPGNRMYWAANWGDAIFSSTIIRTNLDGSASQNVRWGYNEWYIGIALDVPGACCLPDGSCAILSTVSCKDQAGTPQGGNIVCVDDDDDEISTACDNCPTVPNPGQEDCNQDGQGDACDPDPGEGDLDGDGVCDGVDDCPYHYDPEQIDGDGDGVGNACDNCTGAPNPAQEDCNHDGQGDACDSDPGEGDRDGDGVCDGADNCPDDYNPDQIDADGDGFGDECDRYPHSIPAASGWGVISMALGLLTAAKLYFGRRRAPAAKI